MVKSWEKIILRDVCEKINYGFTASSTMKPIGPKFLRITDIVPELINWNDVPFCSISEQEAKKYLLETGDIVIARTGATSGYAKHIKSHPSAIFASYLVRLRIKKEHDSQYIGLIVESGDYKRFIQANLGGSAQPQANAQILTSYPLSLPPLRIQHKIASILSAYDDLIENNTRRIAILEEMAQSLYQEWFVHYRFPGHKKNKLVESELGLIPEGWQLQLIGDVVEVLGGGTPSTKNPEYWLDGDIIWFSPTDLTAASSMFISDSAKKINAQGLQKSSARLFPAGSVMMTSRATIGVIAINTQPACTNQGFITCLPNEYMSAYQLYFWLAENKEKIISLASGSTFREINKATFRGLPVVIPEQKVSQHFNSIVQPLCQQIENLIFRNINLRRTRDLLLPKLIAGELDVEHLSVPSSVEEGLEVAEEPLEAAVSM
ncbi:restriction endonuclease subunit S [Dictyobacter arantiisoli]|uniref:Type I restriction system specificity protein n=1 Tax=Dictyobacter arantiisoli TaxID=2014874 RepID=A0A5A5TBS9_9CHLR|nr:restriction endonuclease subunit S [Dictyobacter arantiisoli]GCF08838.1 type I restriction system specificity protein [Dictyobacter arantiisoli]